MPSNLLRRLSSKSRGKRDKEKSGHLTDDKGEHAKSATIDQSSSKKHTDSDKTKGDKKLKRWSSFTRAATKILSPKSKGLKKSASVCERNGHDISIRSLPGDKSTAGTKCRASQSLTFRHETSFDRDTDRRDSASLCSATSLPVDIKTPDQNTKRQQRRICNRKLDTILDTESDVTEKNPDTLVTLKPKEDKVAVAPPKPKPRPKNTLPAKTKIWSETGAMKLKADSRGGKPQGSPRGKDVTQKPPNTRVKSPAPPPPPQAHRPLPGGEDRQKHRSISMCTPTASVTPRMPSLRPLPYHGEKQPLFPKLHNSPETSNSTTHAHVQLHKEYHGTSSDRQSATLRKVRSLADLGHYQRYCEFLQGRKQNNPDKILKIFNKQLQDFANDLNVSFYNKQSKRDLFPSLDVGEPRKALQESPKSSTCQKSPKSSTPDPGPGIRGVVVTKFFGGVSVAEIDDCTPLLAPIGDMDDDDPTVGAAARIARLLAPVPYARKTRTVIKRPFFTPPRLYRTAGGDGISAAPDAPPNDVRAKVAPSPKFCVPRMEPAMVFKV